MPIRTPAINRPPILEPRLIPITNGVATMSITKMTKGLIKRPQKAASNIFDF